MRTVRYEEFHWKLPAKLTRVDMHIPRTLISLGEAVAVEYRCTKRNGGGDGKAHVWRHKFTRGTILAMDETGKRQLYILGPRLKVTQAGIEH
jgi:hypothetical protein